MIYTVEKNQKGWNSWFYKVEADSPEEALKLVKDREASLEDDSLSSEEFEYYILK